MVGVAVFYLDASENVVPCLASAVLDLVEIVVAQFLEVLQCLLFRDERGGYAYMYLLAAAGLEAYDGTGVVALGALFGGLDLAVGHG